MRIRILPSLLAADVGRLAEEARRAEAAGGDELHLDIMDGHFVPNLSFGPSVVRMARACVRMPLSVHLMLSRPDRYLRTFIEAGADSLLIHVEADCDVGAALAEIRRLGARAGITLNPETPAERAHPFLGAADETLCMTVRPGYGGQSFMPEVLPKIADIRREVVRLGRAAHRILVDGGINEETGALCAAQGADMLVAGTWLFEAPDMAERTALLRERAARAAGLG